MDAKRRIQRRMVEFVKQQVSEGSLKQQLAEQQTTPITI